MKVNYNNTCINTGSLYKSLNYLISIVKKKSLSGFFYKVPLSDALLLEEIGFSRQNMDYHIKKHLDELGIITIVFKGGKTINKKGKEIYKKNLYSVNKDKFLIWYFFCEAANQLDQSKVKRDKNRYNLDFELKSTIESIINSMTIVPVAELFFYSSSKEGKAKELEEQYINSMIIHYYKSMYLNINKTLGIRYNYIYLNLTTRFFIDSVEKDYIIILDELLKSTKIDNKIIKNNSYLIYLLPHIQSINNVLYITAKKSLTDISILDKQWFTNELVTKKKEPYDIQLLSEKANDEYEYSSKENIIEQFFNVNLQTLKPIHIFTNKLSLNELNNLKMDYAVFLCKYSFYFRHLYNLIHELNKGGRNIKLNLNIKALFHNKKNESFYEIKVSCRQSNQLCLLKKETRKKAISDMGIKEKDSFDLHGAIFSVARLINKGEWSCEWDIKNDLSKRIYVDEFGEIINLSKDDLKPLLYRCFFTKGFEDTYKKYRKKINIEEIKRFKKATTKKETKCLSKEVFKQVYDACQEWTGGTFNLTSSIFMIESILELSLLLCHDIADGLENVYDCFYFSPLINEQVLKYELDSIARVVREQIDNCKTTGSFTFDYWKKKEENDPLW